MGEGDYLIFLSYSSFQKNIAEQLFNELSRIDGHESSTFLDLSTDSIPIDGSIPEQIEKALKTCKLGVVLLSKEFIESHWPMKELHILVSRLNSAEAFTIYPLFYDLDMKDLKDPQEVLNKWGTKWNKFQGIDPTQWAQALCQVRWMRGEIIHPNRALSSEIHRVACKIADVLELLPPSAHPYQILKLPARRQYTTGGSLLHANAHITFFMHPIQYNTILCQRLFGQCPDKGPSVSGQVHILKFINISQLEAYTRPIQSGNDWWELIWSDQGSIIHLSHHSCWHVREEHIPNDFVCLSPYFFKIDYNDDHTPPSSEEVNGMVAIKKDLVSYVSGEKLIKLWDDKGSGATQHLSIYTGPDHIGCFAFPHHKAPIGDHYPIINHSKLQAAHPRQALKLAHQGESNCLISLSHSSFQENIAEQLFNELRRINGHDSSTFFDLSTDSIPIGGSIPKQIEYALKTCKLGIVLLSKEFIESHWPMKELDMLVSRLNSTEACTIYPIFYGLDMKDLKDPEEVLNKWGSKWNKLQGVDPTQWAQTLCQVRWMGHVETLHLDRALLTEIHRIACNIANVLKLPHPPPHPHQELPISLEAGSMGFSFHIINDKFNKTFISSQFSDCHSILSSSRNIHSNIFVKTLNDEKTFILHRNQWKALAKSYYYLLDRICYHLQNLDRGTGSNIMVYEIKRMMTAVETVHQTIERGERSFRNYCISIDCDAQSLHRWLVNTAIHLVTSTDILDSHLHDLLWSYATFLLSLGDNLPISGQIGEVCKKHILDLDMKFRELEKSISGFLKEEIVALNHIWKEANVLVEEDGNALGKFLDSFLNANLADFIKDRLSWQQKEQNTDCQNNFTLPEFMWRDEEEIQINLQSPTLLGTGAYGRVYLKEWMGGSFAVKFLYPPPEKNVLEKEATIQGRLNHPNVLHLICCSWCENGAYLLTEKIDKPTDLESLIRVNMQRISKNKAAQSTSLGPFPILDAVEVMLQIAKGMEYLHASRIIHRDLKSSNVLVKMRQEIGSLQLKITDFGLSKWKSSGSFQFSTRNVGTRAWMAPEVVQLEDEENQQGNNAKYNYKADVYSFAMVCLEILTGKLPFSNCKLQTEIKSKVMKGERPEIPEDYPSALKKLIEKCWEHDPFQRPSFKQICNMLRHIKACILLDIHISSDVCSLLDVFDDEYIEATKFTSIKHLSIPVLMLVYKCF